MGRQSTTNKQSDDNASSLAASGDVAELEQMMYQHADSTRIVMLHGDVTEHSIAVVIAQLIHLSTQSKRPIKLVISTYGGAIDEMFSLYDVINMIDCPVHTIALGKVMSAGVLLLASGEKGNRVIGKNARLMIHSVSGHAHGNVFEVQNQADEHKRLQELMVDLLKNETSMSKKQIESIMSDKIDKFITPEDAVKLGIVDVIA